jgi:hypothetical protein
MFPCANCEENDKHSRSYSENQPTNASIGRRVRAARDPAFRMTASMGIRRGSTAARLLAGSESRQDPDGYNLLPPCYLGGRSRELFGFEFGGCYLYE